MRPAITYSTRHEAGHPRPAGERTGRPRTGPLCASSTPDPPPPPPPPLPVELRFCTNKVCRKQGAAAMAKLARDLALPGLTVSESGCLGRCGAGPNVAVLPAGVILAGLATPSRLVEVLAMASDAPLPAGLLAATSARLAGNAAAREGDWAGAEACFSRGLGVADPGLACAASLHANRAAARLARGDVGGALEDARAAVAASAPLPRPSAVATSAAVRLAEAAAAAGDGAGAAAALEAARAGDPDWGKTPAAVALEASLAAKAAAAVVTE